MDDDDGEGDLDPTQFLTIDVKTEEGNLGDDATEHSDLPVATDKDAEEGNKEFCDSAEKSDEQGEKGREAAEVNEEPEVLEKEEGMDIEGKKLRKHSKQRHSTQPLDVGDCVNSPPQPRGITQPSLPLRDPTSGLAMG